MLCFKIDGLAFTPLFSPLPSIAIPSLRSLLARAQSTICGLFDSPDYQTKVEQAAKDGFVLYHGQQKDMKPFFEQCACLLHPSWYPEGMSNVLLETAASARHAITTNRAGCREVVEDGKTGFIVPVQDEKAFLQAVKQFLALPWAKRCEMGLNARAKVAKEFDHQLVVDAYLKQQEKRHV